jgi:hypothetical protein
MTQFVAAAFSNHEVKSGMQALEWREFATEGGEQEE